MARRRRRDDTGDLVARFILLLCLLVGPPVVAWFSQRLWSIVLAVVILVLGILGTMAFLITLGWVKEAERRRRLKAVKNWGVLTPAQFEEYVAELFRTKGYRAQVVGGVADGGIDIRLKQGGRGAVVQCKRYDPRYKVSVEEIRAFCSVVHHSGEDEGFFVTTSSFTREAEDWAKNDKVTLVDRGVLLDWVREAKFGPYAEPMPRPPLFFTAGQWLTLTLLTSTVICVLGSCVSLVIWEPLTSPLSSGQQPIGTSSVISATSTLLPVLTTMPTLAPTPTATSTPLPGPGQAVPVGDLAFTVQEVITMTQIDKYQAQGIFLVVSLWAENIASETRGVGPMDASFRVSDERGRTWEEHQASAPICWQRGHTYIGSAYLVIATDRKVGPGLGFETTAAFDVPADARGFRMTIIDNPSKKQGVIALGR